MYVVPTPIGNLRDITLRALDVLGEVSVICCEDTRHTRKLLSHYGINKRLISCERFSEAKRCSAITAILDRGESIALVSDAGMPGISDPGTLIVDRLRAGGYPVEILPGACAFVTAMAGSGLGGSMRYIGFWPRQQAEARRELLKLQVAGDVSVFYESPHRLLRTLQTVAEVMPERKVIVVRELTKLFEQWLSGTAAEVAEQVENLEHIGEVVVLVTGAEPEIDVDDKLLYEMAEALASKGYVKKDILRILVEETGMKRNELYRLLHRLD